MKVLVFDPGYGDVKCAFVDTDSAEEMRLFKFPTLVTQARGGLDFGERSGRGEIIWSGESWLVGEEAVRVGKVRDTTTNEFLKKYLSLLLGRALLDVEDEVDEVVMAVSLYDWHRRNDFRQVAEKVTVNDQSFTHKVSLIPQGYGIWLECLAPGDGVIVDIGFRTVDVLVFVDGKPDGHRSFGIGGLGVRDFISDAAKLLSARSRVEFLPGEIAHFLQRNDPVFRRFGVEEEIRSKKEEWSARLWNTLTARDDFMRAMALAGSVVIAGGGARFFIRPPSEEIAEGIDLQILKDEPKFANVRGFAGSLLEGGGEEK